MAPPRLSTRVRKASSTKALPLPFLSASLSPSSTQLCLRPAVEQLDSTATTGPKRVRIGAPPAFVRRCLVPLLPAFIERHPDIVLGLRAGDAIVDLAEVGLDLAIPGGSFSTEPAIRG
jgi:hypothetical protein